MARRRTLFVEMEDGLVHRVEMRPQLDGNYDSWVWCERRPMVWADPSVVAGPATCMRCFIADKPKHLPHCEDS